MSDSKVLKYCALWRFAENWFGRFGFYIYGDAAYPLRKWLMVGEMGLLSDCETLLLLFNLHLRFIAALYTTGTSQVGYRKASTPQQEKFNTHGSKARVIVECAFGKLKGQWRCLQNGLKTRDSSMWNDIVLCCCTLHNVTIEVSGAGWAWDAGVVRGSLDPSDTNSTLGEDPDEMGWIIH